MGKAVERLSKHLSPEPSRWREEAEWHRANIAWLRRSRIIAVKMLSKMENEKWTQQQVADKLECSQQYVSKMLKGSENLKIEMLSKIEDALEISLFNL